MQLEISMFRHPRQGLHSKQLRQNSNSVVISQVYGGKDYAALRRAAASSVKLCALSALILTGIGPWCLHPVLHLMQTEQTLIRDCLSYGYVCFGGLAITIFYNLFSAVLRAVGDSRTPLLAIAVASGIAYTSAYSVCNKYVNLFMLPGITLGFAVSAFTGQNFGAGEFRRIRSGTRAAGIMALVSSLILGVALLFFSELLAGLMLEGQEAVGYTSLFLRFLAAFLVLLNLLFVFRSCVQGMGKPAVPMCSGIVEMAVRIAVIFFGFPILGFSAAAYAEGAAWVGALLLNLAAYLFFTGVQRKRETTGRREQENRDQGNKI